MNRYMIRWQDILSVQKGNQVCVIRLLGEESDTDNQWPTLKLTLLEKTLDLSEYHSFESNIMESIIQEILKHCIVSNRKDLALTNEIFANSTNIAITTRRGPGNLAIFAEEEYQKSWKESSQYFSNGFIGNSIKYYVSPYLKSGIIVGYAAPKASLDGGLVLSIIGDTFQIVSLEGSEKYYRFIPRR